MPGANSRARLLHRFLLPALAAAVALGAAPLLSGCASRPSQPRITAFTAFWPEDQPARAPKPEPRRAGKDGKTWPVEHDSLYISSGFGQRGSAGGRGRFHAGVDIIVPRGTPVHATGPGKVIFSGVMRGYGEIVVIDHGNKVSTAYAHLDQRMARVGQQVRQGEQIGTVGRTGNATTDHLHYEVRVDGRPINPDPYLAESARFYR